MLRQLLAVCCVLASAGAQATTVNIVCGRDNTLYEDPSGSLSAGAHTSVYCGVTGQLTNALRRALLHFDVAGTLPAGAQVISAALTVRVSQSSSFQTIIVQGHRVLQDWGEGTSLPVGGGGGSGGPASPGDATWLHAFYPNQQWASAGGDFAPNPSLSIATQSFGVATSPAQAAIVADVQSWLDNPAQNFGWLLKTDESQASTARRIDSRETVFGTPPTLTVTYLMPGQTTAWGTGCPVGGGTFQHAWGGPPIGGTTIQLTQTNGPPGQLAANFLSIGFLPQGFLLHPQCLLYLPIGGIVNPGIFFLSAAGTGSTPLPVPAGFPGILIASQTAAVDPGNPSGYVLSNTMLAVLQ